MSKKWNIFSRKKANKADSHGTTLANEEIEFQPAVRPGQRSHWVLNSQNAAARTRDSFSNVDASHDDNKRTNSAAKAGISHQVSRQSEPIPDISVIEDNTQTRLKLHNKLDDLDCHHSSHQTSGHITLDPNTNSTFDPHPIVSEANIPRISPRVAKKLIKPGGTNAQEPSFLTPTNKAMGVSISDEYTEPFDAIHPNKTRCLAADGYVEPYQPDQAHANRDGQSATSHAKKEVYDEPWDKTAPPSRVYTEYEEPWDNAETGSGLYRPHNLITDQKGKNFINRHEELLLEYPVSGGSHSEDSSSSLASLAKQRMVRIDNSSKSSPHDSPKLDKRLIRPREFESSSANVDPRTQLYNVSESGAKYKPVDHRLIKAEPSFGEVRRSSRSSSRTNSPMGSNRASPNRSPVNTLVSTGAGDHLSDDALRRASSPLVQPMNVSHYLLNKAKSRSLDIRNLQYQHCVRGASGSVIPKSASDDSLSQFSAHNNMSYKGSPVLDGVSEYDEPWDHESHLQQRGPARHHNVAHSRSRSYELGHSSASMYAKHGKSQSFDKPDPRFAKHVEYEQPWDQREPLPQTHVESMHKFQQRKLELHPSEAISHRDFNPLVPLEKQSWFHGCITRDEANRRLENELEGSYLVRNSESIRNNFSLSLRSRTETIHMVISRTRDGFWILGEFSAPFHSIPEMVTFYATHHLKINDTQHISLRYPVPEVYL